MKVKHEFRRSLVKVNDTIYLTLWLIVISDKGPNLLNVFITRFQLTSGRPVQSRTRKVDVCFFKFGYNFRRVVDSCEISWYAKWSGSSREIFWWHKIHCCFWPNKSLRFSSFEWNFFFMIFFHKENFFMSDFLSGLRQMWRHLFTCLSLLILLTSTNSASFINFFMPDFNGCWK